MSTLGKQGPFSNRLPQLDKNPPYKLLQQTGPWKQLYNRPLLQSVLERPCRFSRKFVFPNSESLPVCMCRSFRSSASSSSFCFFNFVSSSVYNVWEAPPVFVRCCTSTIPLVAEVTASRARSVQRTVGHGSIQPMSRVCSITGWNCHHPALLCSEIDV